MKEIPLTKGLVSIVDDEDFPLISKYKWHALKARHGYTTGGKIYGPGNPKGTPVSIHRLIMNPPPGFVVDHKDGNGLNNTRANLRIATHAQNIANQLIRQEKKSSKYKGLTWDKTNKSWAVSVNVNKKRIWLGRFKDEIEAAKAYDDAAKKAFGEFAKLNFGEGGIYATPEKELSCLS